MHCSRLQLGRHLGSGRFLGATTEEVLRATTEEVLGATAMTGTLYAVEQERCAVWGGRLWGGQETSRGSGRADNGVHTLK